MTTRSESPQLAGHRVKLPKQCVLYSEGDEVDGWYEILSGVVRTCRYLYGGHRQVTGFFFPRDVIGVEKGVYRATAEAITDVLVVRHGRRLLEPESATITVQMSGAEEILNRALERAEDRAQLLGMRGAAVRLAGFLLAMATHRLPDGYVHLPMRRADIADYLAIDAATVSRVLTQFVKQGALNFHGAHLYRINDPRPLEALAEGEAAPGSSAADWEDAPLSARRTRGPPRIAGNGHDRRRAEP